MKARNNILLLGLLGLLAYAAVKHDGGPTPDPIGPIIGKGLRVLIVEETAQRSKLPPEQVAELTSADVRDYLNAKCANEASGAKAWRIFDKDTDTSNEAKFWKDAMARNRDGLPWLIISNGRKGYEGALPKDCDSLLELLKKYE